MSNRETFSIQRKKSTDWMNSESDLSEGSRDEVNSFSLKWLKLSGLGLVQDTKFRCSGEDFEKTPVKLLIMAVTSLRCQELQRRQVALFGSSFQHAAWRHQKSSLEDAVETSRSGFQKSIEKNLQGTYEPPGRGFSSRTTSPHR